MIPKKKTKKYNKLQSILIYIFFIFLLCSGCHGGNVTANSETIINSNFGDTLFKIGYYNSLSKSEKLVLYKTEYPSKGGESIGDLKIWNIITNREFVLFDSIPTNISNAVFVSDSLILVPTDNNILLYDIGEHLVKSKLLNLNKGDFLLGFALEPNKKSFASVLVNFKSKSSELITFNLETNKKKSIILPFDFESSEYYPDAIFYWTESGIVVSLQNYLVLYNPFTEKIATISDSLEHHSDNSKFFVSDSNIVFKAKKNVYALSLKTMKISLNKDFIPDDRIEFYTGNIKNDLKGYVLNNGSFYKFENNAFVEVKRLPIVETEKLLIYKLNYSLEKFFIQNK